MDCCEILSRHSWFIKENSTYFGGVLTTMRFTSIALNETFKHLMDCMILGADNHVNFRMYCNNFGDFLTFC